MESLGKSSAITSKLNTLLRMGLVSKNNVRRAMTLFADPEKAMKNPAYRMLMQEILVDVVDRVLNNKSLYTALRSSLAKESNFDAVVEGVEKEREKTLLRSGLVKRKDVLAARRALESPEKAKSMSSSKVYRDMMITMLDSMVSKITGSPILFNAFKATLNKEKVEESFEVPTEEGLNMFWLCEDAQDLMEKNKPTKPDLWAQAKSKARAKFDVYPSAYANGWAVKWYNEHGGGWKSVSEGKTFFNFIGDLHNKKSSVHTEEAVTEIIEEGVRFMAGAETMINDNPAGGASLSSSFRKIKKRLENKPTGSVLLVTTEKSSNGRGSPESVSVDIYEPSDFKTLIGYLSPKPEAKVGSKGSWREGDRRGEVIVVGIKEEVEIKEANIAGVGYALVVDNKIVHRGNKKSCLKLAKQKYGGLKQGKVFIAHTPKEVGDKFQREAVELDELNVPDAITKNLYAIARKTVKMNDVMVRVMGGMNKKKAHEFLLKHGTTSEKAAAKKFLGMKESLDVHTTDDIEEGVRMMTGAEKMVKDDPIGGSDMVKALRLAKKSLGGKPTGSVIVVSKEKNPDVMEIKTYTPREFASVMSGYSKKPDAVVSFPFFKIGSKGVWSNGEDTVVAIKEEGRSSELTQQRKSQKTT